MTKKYHHGDLKKALIKAGYRLVKEQGIEDVSLRKIAATVGVSHAAPKHHFPDIKSLLSHIAAKGYRSLNQNLVRLESDKLSLDHFNKAERSFLVDYFKNGQVSYSLMSLFFLGNQYIHFAFENEYIYELMTSLELSDERQLPELNLERKLLLLKLVDIIEECQSEGTIRPGNPEDLALFVWSTVHGFISLVLRRQFSAKGIQKDPKELQMQLMRSIALGLRGRNPEISNG